MRKWIVNLLLSTLAVLFAAWLTGVEINGFIKALIVAFVFGLLNRFVKPILTLLTIPVTILTLGIFLLVINVIMVYLTAWIVGFQVPGFWSALIFSIVVGLVNSFLKDNN